MVNDTGSPNDRDASPCVARQYSGTPDQTANCQVAVSVHLAGEGASCAADWRLFCPASWRRRKTPGWPRRLRWLTGPVMPAGRDVPGYLPGGAGPGIYPGGFGLPGASGTPQGPRSSRRARSSPGYFPVPVAAVTGEVPGVRGARRQLHRAGPLHRAGALHRDGALHRVGALQRAGALHRAATASPLAAAPRAGPATGSSGADCSPRCPERRTPGGDERGRAGASAR